MRIVLIIAESIIGTLAALLFLALFIITKSDIYTDIGASILIVTLIVIVLSVIDGKLYYFETNTKDMNHAKRDEDE